MCVPLLRLNKGNNVNSFLAKILRITISTNNSGSMLPKFNTNLSQTLLMSNSVDFSPMGTSHKMEN